MDAFRIVAFYVSMASSSPVILTTTMILFLQRTPVRHFSSKSRSSGHRLDSIRPVPSPSLSTIRYRKMSFDTSAFSERTNRISLSSRFSKSMLQMRKSAIRPKRKCCGFWWNRSVIF